MLSKLIVLAGLACLSTAGKSPILGLKKQLRLFPKGKDVTLSQVQPLLSSPPNCRLNSRKANPLNRETFFQCTINGLALMKCPEKMVFEAASSSCIRDNSAPENETPPTCVENGSYIPSSTTCGGFWQCSNGTPYYQPCPADLYFNPDINVCDWKDNVISCGPRWWASIKKSTSPGNSITDKESEKKGKL